MTKNTMKVELLYFNDCPSWKAALGNLRVALREEQIDADVALRLIETDEQAQAEHFLGSPSFRIDGQELWPEEREAYFLGCRVYATDSGLSGVPTVAMLRSKLGRRKHDQADIL